MVRSKDSSKERPISAEQLLGMQLQKSEVGSASEGAWTTALPHFDAQYRPLVTRKFRLDYAFPPLLLGIEVDGGLWTSGAHIRPAGRESDMMRDAQLSLHGWHILRFSPKHVQSGLALKIIVATVDRLTGYLTKERLAEIDSEIKAYSVKVKRGGQRRNQKGTSRKRKQSNRRADGEGSRKHQPDLPKRKAVR